MIWQKLKNILLFDTSTGKVLDWKDLLRRKMPSKKTYLIVGISLFILLCMKMIPFLYIEGLMWKSELETSTSIMADSFAADSYARGGRKLLELTEQNDFDERNTGRKAGDFEIWTHTNAKFARTIPFLPCAFEVSAAGYVKGWNRCMQRKAEGAARRNLEHIANSQNGYKSAHGAFAMSFAELGKDGSFPLKFNEDNSLDGYTYTFGGNADCYTLRADPTVPGVTGENHLFMDCSGRRFYNSRCEAGPNDHEIICQDTKEEKP